MTLSQIIDRMCLVALTQPSVKMVVPNDPFRLSMKPGAKYGVFSFVQGTHRHGAGNLDRYSFTLMYIDRIGEDDSNEIEVQSTGVSTLDNILRTLADEWEVSEWSITTFRQRFADECGGAMAAVTFGVPAGSTCGTVFTTE